MVIFDTNILIELFRGNVSIKEQVLEMNVTTFYISSISYVEFLAGARNKKEAAILTKQLEKYTLLPVTEDIDSLFLEIYNQFLLSHRPQIPDMLIAATALYYDLPLFTLNKKDFHYIPDLKLI